MSASAQLSMESEMPAPVASSVAFAPERRRASILDVPPVRPLGPSVIAGAGTVVVHLALVALATFVGTRVAREVTTPAMVTQLIDVELPPDITRQPVAEPVQREPVRASPPSRRAASATHAAPPPAAAQAAQVLTAAGEVIEFGETFVAGEAASYAGGVTETGGSAEQAVRDTGARAGGVTGGTGTALAGDRSRAPVLAGGARWDCPFPEEGEDRGIDHAVVTLRVEVATDGSVVAATIASDPGDGFGREARRCALRKRWSPGLDRAGNPTGAAALINVRFDR
jgi:protein TonB